jgi:DNA-directed RNA polymerase subunit RPC12/RpoP
MNEFDICPICGNELTQVYDEDDGEEYVYCYDCGYIVI